jgi:hypothetical protein
MAQGGVNTLLSVTGSFSRQTASQLNGCPAQILVPMICSQATAQCLLKPK